MTSIRTRITSAVVGCTALVVAAAALIVGTTARTMIEKGLDDRLRGRARWFTTVWRAPPPGTEARDGRSERDGRDARSDPRDPREARADGRGDARPDGRSDGRPEGRPDGRPDGRDPRDSRDGQNSEPSTPSFYAESRDAGTNEEIQRSPWLPKEVSLASFGGAPGDPIRTVRFPDGRPMRLLVVASESRVWSWSRDRGRDDAQRDPQRDASRDPPREAPPAERRAAVTWLVADASDVESEGNRLAWILAAVWAGATVLAWGAAVKLSGAVLRPVESLSRTIGSLQPTHLSARVPMEHVPAELSIVVQRLNALLERLELAFRRERATIANMAHELRNPISALRTTLEFGLYQELTPQGRKTVESSLALAMRMQSLVNGLLTLSRIEAGQEVLAREPVDLVQALRDAWNTVESRARERDIEPVWNVPESLSLVTSPAHVELVAANLLDNAVSHGVSPGEVEIELARDGDRALLRIANPCSDERDRAGFFEPFWRSDPARSDTRHFGLGLALCDRVVRLLGGTIEAEQKAQRFVVTVRWPSVAAAKELAPV